MQLALPAGLFALIAVAAVADLRTRRVPNVLTVSALALALAMRSFAGPGSLLDGVQGVGLAFLVVVPIFAIGAFGGGDAKLLIAVGAFLGPREWLWALLYTGLAGGLMALVATMRNGTILPALASTGGLLKHAATLGRKGDRPDLDTPAPAKLPYAVAIGIGTSAAWLF